LSIYRIIQNVQTVKAILSDTDHCCGLTPPLPPYWLVSVNGRDIRGYTQSAIGIQKSVWEFTKISLEAHNLNFYLQNKTKIRIPCHRDKNELNMKSKPVFFFFFFSPNDLIVISLHLRFKRRDEWSAGKMAHYSSQSSTQCSSR